jgi:hypothetical protein
MQRARCALVPGDAEWLHASLLSQEDRLGLIRLDQKKKKKKKSQKKIRIAPPPPSAC